jgi:hypothetical protein
MMEFSLAGFAAFITNTLVRGLPIATHHALDQAGALVEREAKRVLGTYDYGWPPLAASTIARKSTGDSPGLETGEMRDSVHYYVTTHSLGHGEVHVGSDLDKALWFEFGTRTQPPRPWLTTAARHMEPLVVKMVGGTVAAFLGTGNPKAHWAQAAE